MTCFSMRTLVAPCVTPKARQPRPLRPRHRHHSSSVHTGLPELQRPTLISREHLMTADVPGKSTFVQLNCVVVDPETTNRQELATFLANCGVNVVSQLPGPETLPSILARSDGAQLVVINLDPHPHETLKRVGVLVRQFANVHFFVMSQVVDPQLLMEAMHLGIKEFMPLPVAEEKFAA